MSEEQKQGLSLQIEMTDSISLVSNLDAGNVFPCIKSLAIQNKANQSFNNIVLTIHFEPKISEDKSFPFSSIYPGDKVVLSPKELGTIIFSSSFFSQVHQTQHGTISFEVKNGDQVLLQEIRNITILPYNQWGGTGTLRYSQLARFVMPKLPGVKNVVLRASQLLLKEKNANLDGYQSDPNGVRDQVNAIFSVLRSCQISYMNPPSNFETNGQEIRIPEETLRNQGGTCIDMAVLLASCLENISLHPIIFLVEGHAYAGCFLNEEDSLKNEVDASYGRIYGLIQSKKILAIECTAMCSFAKNTTFDQALMSATSNTLNNEMTLNAVDIRLCRETGISPLPLAFDPIQGKIVFDSSTNDSLNSTIGFTPDAPLQVKKKLETRFDVWEKELLDLNMSNPLLNFHIRGSSITFFNGDIRTAFESLKAEKKFTIVEYPLTRDIPKSLPGILEINENKLNAQDSNRLFESGRIMAISRGSNLASNLKDLYRRSRDTFEETGANPLYLSVGLLKYYEPGEINLGNFKLSPVILIPVELIRSRGTTFYALALQEEDWVINQTLLEYLRRNYNVDISKLLSVENQEDGSVDIPGILDFLTSMISDQDHWILYGNYIGLGVFDFSHYVMWESLHRHRSLYEQKPIISALASGSNSNLDKIDDKPFNETEMCAPLTADSSQLMAINNSSEGKSFILFGPPGTGKSQTIVNIICNLLFEGKQVLFVSEKKAALDVVYSRMKQLGLQSFCLSLHSSKVKKGNILNQFSKSFKAASQFGEPIDYEEKVKEIQETKENLTRIFREFNTASSYFLSINDAFIQYEANKDFFKHIPYSDDFLKSLTRSKIADVKTALDQLVFIEEKSSFTYFGNPLMPLQSDHYGLVAKEQVSTTLASLRESKVKLDSAFSGIWPQKGSEQSPVSFQIISCLSHILERAGNKNGLLPNKLGKSLFIPNQERIQIFLEKIKKFQSQPFLEIRERIDPSKISLNDFNKGFEDYLAKISKHGLFSHLASAHFAKKFFKPFAKRKIKSKEIYPTLSEGRGLIELYEYLKKEEPFIQSVFGKAYKGLDTSFQQLSDSFSLNSNLDQLLSTVKDLPARDEIISILSEKESKAEILKSFLLSWNDFSGSLKQAESEIGLSTSILFSQGNWSTSFDSSLERIGSHLDSLVPWGNLMSAINNAESLGLKPLLEAYRNGEIPAKSLWRTFLADSGFEIAISAIRSLKVEGFSGLAEEGIRKKYYDLYQEFRALSLAELKAKLASKIPSANNSDKLFGELGFLTRNISSGGKGQTIRSLLSGAPNLIRALCPCFLMSPSSVASFLDEDTSFNAVIFDEASQIPTAEALGSILRGKSLIVCGDLKQLPPTTFFKTADDTENYALASLPSILDDCKAILMPEIELKWHYRSKNESLIAFSNQEFYDSSLFTFPSFDDSVSMVKYVYVSGIYDRGKTRTNEAEANAIVNEVLKLKTNDKTKKFSIGIVTFSAPQKKLIEDLMDDMFSKYPSVKDEDDQSIEPIFVKNIENVQGDERDIIIFSIGYGLDKDGKLSYNFGPLNGDKGYRRLNVAITRSRVEMMVFTNIDPDKVAIERVDNMGAQYLFRFLQYAKDGRKALVKNNRSLSLDPTIVADSIAKSLESCGYLVSKNIGDSKFRIHLALSNPQEPHKYVLGIMIEGEKNNHYSIVDKLEIQPGVLTALGWHLMRVYLIDWINSPDAVLSEIKKEYETALKDNRSALDESFSVESKNVVFTRPIRTVPQSKKDHFIKDFEDGEYGIYSTDFFRFEKISSFMTTIIETESPISANALYAKICRIFSITRMGSKMRDQYNAAIESLHYKTTRNPDGTEFFWDNRKDPMQCTYFRKNSPQGVRDFVDIPQEELAVLCYDQLLKQYAMPKEELISSIKNFLEYNPRSAKMKELLEKEVDWAIANRKDLFSIDKDNKLIANKK